MIIDIARHGITPSNIGFQAELFPNGPENLTSKGFLECFEEGMTVRECCNPTNLAWTKRINNSRKYNKQR